MDNNTRHFIKLLSGVTATDILDSVSLRDIESMVTILSTERKRRRDADKAAARE